MFNAYMLEKKRNMLSEFPYPVFKSCLFVHTHYNLFCEWFSQEIEKDIFPTIPDYFFKHKKLTFFSASSSNIRGWLSVQWQSSRLEVSCKCKCVWKTKKHHACKTLVISNEFTKAFISFSLPFTGFSSILDSQCSYHEM